MTTSTKWPETEPRKSEPVFNFILRIAAQRREVMEDERAANLFARGVDNRLDMKYWTEDEPIGALRRFG